MAAYRKEVIIGATAAVVGVVGTLIFLIADAALYSWSHFTGWTLVALCLTMVLYGARRKFLRVAASTQLLVHVYLGLTVALLFFTHAGGLPEGAFGQILWGLFVAILASGIFGLICEKLPTLRGNHTPYARIIVERAMLAEQAGDVYRQLLQSNPPLPFTRYYARRLVPYFATPANLWGHLRGSRAGCDTILLELEYIGSELVEDENYLRLRSLVNRKNDLDRRRALFWLQRGWLFIHLPALAAASVMTVAHIVLVYAFGG